MALAGVVQEADFAKLAEPLQQHYVKQDDGTYHLDTNVEEHPRTQGLKSALVKERDEVKRAKAALRNLGEGKPADGEEKDGEPDEWAKRTRSYANELAKRDKELADLRASNRTLTVRSSIAAALAASGAPAKVLAPHIESRAELDEQGRLFLRGDDGQPLRKSGWTDLDQYMTVGEYVTGLKSDPDFGKLFPKAASGSETVPSAHQPKPRPTGGKIETIGGMRVFRPNQ